jgi:hypothetical protein
MMSAFAVTGRAKEDGGPDDLPFDEGRMEKAMQTLASEAESINEEDPAGGEPDAQADGYDRP